MKTQKIIVILKISVMLCFLLANCSKKEVIVDESPITPENTLPAGATALASTPQRGGDAQKGYKYLVEGDFLSSGFPINVFKAVFGESKDELGRTGDNATIPYQYTALTAPSGAKIVTLNCLNCHAEKIDGKLIVGLGNNTADNTVDQSNILKSLDLLIKNRYKETSPEWLAYAQTGRASQAAAPYVVAKVQGLNLAQKLFAVLAAHRRPDDLKWLDEAQNKIPTESIASDVPALWLLKKKNTLYYTSGGRGDFARLMMSSSLLTMTDSTEARKIDTKFADVLAYFKTLEAPKYPYFIDQALAAKGRIIFDNSCAKCHGKYGTNSTYPNLVIDLAHIGTDPALAEESATNYPEYFTWYNQSWFSKNPNKATLQAIKGYIPPPLDGIWATAPYLHNGSIPTLDDLLNTSQRPKYWQRSFNNDSKEYDQAKLGWKYEIPKTKANIQTYDTSLKGYKNTGHTYGDALTTDDRKALIEYLKTL